MSEESAQRFDLAIRFLRGYGFVGGFFCGFAAGLVVGWQLALWFAWAGATTLYLKERRGRTRAEGSRGEEIEQLRLEVARLEISERATGFLNRSGLAAAFEDRKQALVERDLVITVLAIEIERLRQVEEVQGPESAKSLVDGVAAILREALGDEDCAGRFEDGRFVLLLCAPRYERPGEELAHHVQRQAAADRDLYRFGRPVALSIGMTRIARADTSFCEAVAEADQALRAATGEGSGRIAVYRAKLGREHEFRRSVLREVAAALEADCIIPVYQPIIAVDDRRIVAFEALARVCRPDGALVEAGRLRPAFEDPHFSTDVSERMLVRALADVGRLRRAGLECCRFALNVTERQIADPDFAERVLDHLMVEGLSPQDLSLEIAEQVLLSSREPLIAATLTNLADAGVELAFDDFGTGYAALSNLRRFPVDTIKLERAFVADILEDPDARAICAGVIGMAQALGRHVVAEGVETAGVHEALEELGCNRVQGFYYSPPVTFGEVERMVRTGLAA